MPDVVTDIHCHYVPGAYLRHLERQPQVGLRWSWVTDEEARLDAGNACFAMSRDFVDVERHLRRMERLGIERSVLSLATPLIDYRASSGIALEGARIVNDELAAVQARWPGRFEGWAYLPMQAPEEAAGELERAVSLLGLRGAHVSSNVNGRYLDAAEFRAVFDTAVRLDVPVFVHPSNPPGRERMATYELAVVSGYLFDTTLNIFNMIFGGFLDRYPGLRVCCTHAGGYALSLRGRVQREVDTNPELAARITRTVGEYLRQLFYDTVSLEPAYLRYGASVVGTDRFVLGSDAPFPLGEPDPVGFVREALGDAAAIEEVVGRNVERLFSG